MSPPLPGAPPPKAPRLPRLLANTGWNVAGQLIPMLIGLAVLPLLIRTLGLERYGFLTLVWVLVGYASVFDFGIGRVLIRVVALRLARGDGMGADHVARVGMTFLCGLGMAVGAVFAVGSDWLLGHVVKLPAAMNAEALQAMWLLGVSIPFVMLTTGYVGVLSAHQQFQGLNILRAAMGIASYLGPLGVALWLNRLDALVAFTLLMRVAAAAAHAHLARRHCGYSFAPLWPDRPTTRELLSLGGWVSVSNVVGPMLTYLDRLLLGALVPIRTVAFYATPFDLISRTTFLPYSLMAATYPSAAAVLPGSTDARRVLLQSARLLYVLMLPLMFSFVVLARPGLHWWLGEEFAAQGAPVLQILAVGVFLNMLAQAPAMLIQAAGQPRLMALLHLAELPIFVGLLYAFTVEWGIVGTAAASALRNGLDAVALLLLARRDVLHGEFQGRSAAMPAMAAALMLAAALLPSTAVQSGAVLVVGWACFVMYAWQLVLLPNERERLLQLLRPAA